MELVDLRRYLDAAGSMRSGTIDRCRARSSGRNHGRGPRRDATKPAPAPRERRPPVASTPPAAFSSLPDRVVSIRSSVGGLFLADAGERRCRRGRSIEEVVEGLRQTQVLGLARLKQIATGRRCQAKPQAGFPRASRPTSHLCQGSTAPDWPH
jgi:hypothetical protein